MALPMLGSLLAAFSAGAQPSKAPAAGSGKTPPKPRWVLVRDWAEDRSNVKPSEGGTAQTRSKRALAITSATRTGFGCKYSYSYTSSIPPRNRVDVLGKKIVDIQSVNTTVVRTHTWEAPPEELLPDQKLTLRATVSADGSTYSVSPPEADSSYYKAQALSGGETGVLLRLMPESRDPSSPYGGNQPQPQEVGRVQAVLGQPAPSKEVVIPARTSSHPYLELLAWCAYSRIESSHTHTFRYEWRDRPLIEPPCAEACYFYTPKEMSLLYSGTVPPLYHTREQVIAQLVGALKQYEAEAALQKRYPVPYAANQPPEVDAPRLAGAFYSGAVPTGAESALRSAIVGEFGKTGRRLEPGDVFLFALRASQGNIRDALVTAHATLYRNGKGAANTNKQFIETYLVPMRNPEAYNSTDKLFPGKDASGNPIQITPRAVLGDDQQGLWYHLFGTATIEYQDRAALTPFAVQRFGIEHVASWLGIQPPHVSSMSGKQIPTDLGTALSNYCLSLENLVRSRGGSAPDPDKQCVNYTGIAAGKALLEYARTRQAAWETAAQRKFDEGLGISGGTPTLGSPVLPNWNPAQGGMSVAIKSPVSLRIVGTGGEDFRFDQVRRRFGGNTSQVLLDVLPEDDGTWGMVATPLFPVKSIELTGARAGDATVGVFRFSDHKVNAGTLPVKPGERFVVEAPASGSVPPLPARVVGADPPPVPLPTPPTTPGTEGKEYRLEGPSAGALVAREYPRRNVRLDLTVTYTKPGVILDTVGINAAPIGSWTLRAGADEKFSLNVYDPGRRSPYRLENGWHVLTTRGSFPAGKPHRITIDVTDAGMTLRVNGKEEASLPLATPLSGEPLYAGDFPGDDHWGAKYNIHPAMTGIITIHHAGPLPENADVAVSPLVIDRKNSLTTADRRALESALATLRTDRGLALAVVIAGDATEDEIRALATDTRAGLVRVGKLPAQSGVLVLFGTDKERRLWWSRDRSLDTLITADEVMSAWRAIPASEGIAQSALRLFQSLRAPLRTPQ